MVTNLPTVKQNIATFKKRNSSPIEFIGESVKPNLDYIEFFQKLTKQSDIELATKKFSFPPRISKQGLTATYHWQIPQYGIIYSIKTTPKGITKLIISKIKQPHIILIKAL